MAAVELRPRSNTELLDAAVELVRRHFGVLATTVAIGQLPGLVLNMIWPPSRTDPFAAWRAYPVLMTTRVLLLLAVYSTMAIMFAGVVDALVHGRPVVLAAELRRAARRALPALVLYVLTYLVFFLWLLLFFLPAIWAYARYFAGFPAMAIEGLGPLAAIRRSKELARGNNLRIIAVTGIPFVLGLVIAFIVQQGMQGLGVRATIVAGIVVMAVLYPFMATPTIFMYYDIRTRREGLDLDPAALASPPPPSAAA